MAWLFKKFFHNNNNNKSKMSALLQNKLALAGIAAAAAFVGYCIYFDQKRRAAPDFREKLTEKRRQAKLEEEQKRQQAGQDLPTREQMMDQRALKQYFVDAMAAGQEAMHQGNMQMAARCFVNALRVYQDPAALLQVLKQTVPPELFMRVVQELQELKTQQAE
eukprot:m.233280 g.233280  ORF g.233280 m.233280 type:complete len:163 (-) comp17082_c5_seq2:100-588(-)